MGIFRAPPHHTQPTRSTSRSIRTWSISVAQRTCLFPWDPHHYRPSALHTPPRDLQRIPRLADPRLVQLPLDHYGPTLPNLHDSRGIPTSPFPRPRTTKRTRDSATLDIPPLAHPAHPFRANRFHIYQHLRILVSHHGRLRTPRADRSKTPYLASRRPGEPQTHRHHLCRALAITHTFPHPVTQPTPRSSLSEQPRPHSHPISPHHDPCNPVNQLLHTGSNRT